jgi:hypothetical protein
MAEARITNELACSEDVFWEKLFFDTEFNRRLFLTELGFVQWKILSEKTTDDFVERELDVTPKVTDVPGPVKAVIGDSLGYHEHGRYDRKRRRYAVKATSPVLGDRFLLEGEMYTETLGENRCRRIFNVKVTTKIFGVGGLIEKRVIADLEKSYAESAKFIGKYVQENQL